MYICINMNLYTHTAWYLVTKKTTHREYVNIIDRRVENRTIDMSIFKNLINSEG